MMMTTSYALFQAANNTAILRDLEPERQGHGVRRAQSVRNLGLIGTSLMGGAFAAASLRTTFALGSGLVFVALLTAIRLGRQAPRLEVVDRAVLWSRSRRCRRSSGRFD
ncbi:MAG: hypothetical protein U0527_05735 [Candidatus Eisenbacteria bacterium]